LTYIRFDILGDSLKVLRGFPDDARRNAGFQIDRLQQGLQPDDFKPMPSVGKGVEELRLWSDTGTYRVIYIARLADAVYVLHAFQKTSEKTPQKEIDIAAKRLRELLKDQR
jgi:phage-related protein